MKKTYYFYFAVVIIALGTISPSIRAQYSFPAMPQAYNSDSIKIVKATVFPLGALLTGDAGAFLDSLKRLSINTVTNFTNGGGQDDVAPSDTLGSVSGANGWIPPFYDYREERMYFFSGIKRDTDRVFDYGTYNNTNGIDFNKWYYNKVDTVSGGVETFLSSNSGDTLSLQAERDTFSNSAYGGQYMLRAQRQWEALYYDKDTSRDTSRYAHYFDFIYRFDTTDLFTYNSSDTLYMIELWLRGRKDSSLYGLDGSGYPKYKLYDSIIYVPIKKSDFSSSDAAWDNHSSLVYELDHILHDPQSVSGKYRRMHIVLGSALMNKMYNYSNLSNLSAKYRGEDSWYGQQNANKLFIDFRVRRIKPIRMYVKGLRMREAGAEKLLTGQLDSVLVFRFKMISQSKYLIWNDGTKKNDTLTGNYYPNLLNLQTENEPYPNRYYIIGYLDRFARDHNDPSGHPFKRLTAFSPWNPREIRLIWDDILWKSNMQDAAPQHLYRNIDYQAGDYIHLGLPRDMFPKTLPSRFDLYRQPIVDRSNEEIFEHQHDSLLNLSFRGNLAEVNQAAFTIGTKPVPFWIMGQAYTGLVLRNSSGYPDNSNFPGRFSTALDYMVDSIRAILIRSSTTDCSALDKVWDGTKIFDTAKTAYDRSNLTTEEIRLQANMCAAYGAKGFTVSNAGTNGLREYGFTGAGFDHSTDMYDSTKRLMSSWMVVSDSFYYQIKHKGVTENWTFSRDGTLDTNTWEYRGSGCAARRGQYIPYRSPNTTSLYCLNDCASSLGFWSWLPTFYGWKTRYEGVRLGMSDLNKVADTLARITWDTTFNYINYKVAGNSPSQLIPIKNLASIIQSKKRRSSESDHSYSDSLSSGIPVMDDSTKQYVEVGAFHDTTQKHAHYIYVVNRRVWCNKPSSDTTTDNNFLGNVAVRKIRFKVAVKNFGIDSTFYPWQISDLSTGKDTIIFKDSLYAGVTLEPGEGHLLRIAPATALALGRMDNDLFNNARHICPVEVDNQSSLSSPLIKGYLATYARDGKVVVSYPIEDTSAFVLEKRHAAIPVDSIVDGSGNCLTPSIAYSRLSHAIGLIYTSVIHGTTKDTNIIWYKRSLLSTPYIFTTKVLDTVIVNNTVEYYASPAIVPSNDTNHDFWVAWRAQTDKGGRVGIVNQSGILTSSSYFNAGIPSETAFISLASHTGVVGAHLAWQEYSSWGIHDIHFLKAQFDGSFTVSVNGHVNLSAPSKWCDNYHPQIATDETGSDHVVWEVYDAWRFNHDLLFYGGATVLRERDASRNFWGDYNEYFQLSGITPQNYLGADVHYQYAFYPNIASGGNFSITMEPDVFALGSNLWKDFRRITWSNPSSEHIDLMHWGAFDWKWNGAIMLDGSLEPSMAECSNWLVVPSAMLYRAPVLAESGTNARMTRYRFPNTPVANVPASKLLWRQIWARGAWGCRTLFLAAMGNNTTINSASSSIAVGIHPRSYPSTDTTPPPLPNAIIWNDKSVQTDKFALHASDTIYFQRYFDVGNDLSTSDTASMQAFLTSYSDYLKARVYLRKNSDSSIVAILDTAILTKTGFNRTGTTNDIQGVYITPYGFSTDTMFVSMELMRGDTNNSYQISLNDLYGTDQMLPSISYKKSDPTPRPQTASESEQIKVSVVPNPFKSTTQISIDVPMDVPLSIFIYDALGRQVAKLYNGISERTSYNFMFGDNTTPSGTYYVRIQAGNSLMSRQIQLLK